MYKYIFNDYLPRIYSVFQHILYDVPAVLDVWPLQSIQERNVIKLRHYMAVLLFRELWNKGEFNEK